MSDTRALPRITRFPTTPSEILRLARRGDPLLEFQWGPHRVFLAQHPDLVQQILREDHSHYGKQNFFYDIFRRFVGQGLVSSDGELWQRQRRLSQPPFRPKRVAQLDRLLTPVLERHLADWQQYADSGEPVDMHAHLKDLALAMLAAALLDGDPGEATAALARALNLARGSFPALAMDQSGTQRPNRDLTQALQLMDGFVEELLAPRPERPIPEHSPLAIWLAAHRAGEMSRTQLRDEIVTLLFAGNESTTAALLWTFYLLAMHPPIERRVRAEVDEVLAGRTPTHQDLARLEYTDRVIKESMRLYPPVWAVFRTPHEERRLGDYTVPAGATVMLALLVTHRHPDFWENPEGFDPDRFTPERSQGRHHFAYLPFLTGPRVCIGDSFARLEIPLAIAMILQRYRLELLPGLPVEPSLSSQIVPDRMLMQLVPVGGPA